MKSDEQESELSKIPKGGEVNAITKINTLGRAFDFLDDEPELYSRKAIVKQPSE